jgi:hypothetical protein
MTSTDRKALAELARQHADECWLDRRAYLSIAVALAETGSDTAARKAIASIGVAEVRDRAAGLLEQLLANDVPATRGAEKEGTA